MGTWREEIRDLCDAALDACWRAPRRSWSVLFRFRGKRYRARMTNFRVLVQTLDGRPVCCRWW